ncbi:MAG: 30S ribosomal protein S6 [Gaiellaceae bacterium]
MGRKAIGTVTTYEILLMLDPDQAEARQDEIVARARELVEKSGGTWQSHDPWGRRRLAYPIEKKEEGVYHLVVFESEAGTLDEVSRVLKIDDAVLRHMATRHIAGSRTSAPRDDAAAAPVASAPSESEPGESEPAESESAESEPAEAAPAEPEADVSAEEEPEYAPTDEEPDEVPAKEEE